MSNRWLSFLAALLLLAVFVQPAAAAAAGTALGSPAPHFLKTATSKAVRKAVCSEDAFTLCLLSNRFEVFATWDTNTGQSGDAQVVRLTDDTGYLWFFSSANVETVVKMLDACNGFNNFWFFAGGLTNVHVVITVNDTLTGLGNTYENPQNTPFQPIQDTSAFATCP